MKGFLACGFLGALPSLISAAQFQFGHRTLTVPDGYVVEQVAGPPLIDRPIMADFDDQGRLYVADSAGVSTRVQEQLETKPHRILRLEDTDGDGRFDKRTVFADHMMFPEGILWFNGAIYCGAPPTIWRLEDTNDDGVADQRTAWFEGKTLTGCANDLHGPYLGPDGWIYWCKGAFAQQTHARDGRPPISDSAAHIFRCRPNGGAFDAVMSGGMDNPVEIAFTPGGDPIFTTTFFVHPGGGLRDALVLAVYGGVYPKTHGVLDNLTRTGDLLPPLTHLGPAVPCGLTRYESGALGQDFKNNLLSCQFNMHRVQRHILQPQGSTYQTRDLDFLTCDHPDFHPTDVLEDGDGSLLVIDTGGWYKICCPSAQIAKPDVLGAIFRVRRQGAPEVQDPRGLQLAWDDLNQVAKRLDDSRLYVRRRALAQLATDQAIPALAALPEGTPLRRLNRVWALTRIDDPHARQLTRQALADPEADVRQAAAHSSGIYRDTGSLPSLCHILETDNPRLQRAAATALGQIGDATVVPDLLSAAGQDVDRFYEHSIIYALIELGDGQAIARGLEAREPRTRRAALIALDQLGSLKATQVTPLLADANPILRETSIWIASRHPDWAPQMAGFFREQLQARGTKTESEELENQLSRFGGEEPIQEILVEVFPAAPSDSRRLIIRAMARAGVKETPAAWWQTLLLALDDTNPKVREAAVATLRALPNPKDRPESLSTTLLRLAEDPNQTDALRLEALAACSSSLSELSAPLFDFLISCLGSDRPPLVRDAAAGLLARTRLQTNQLVRLTEQIRHAGPFEVPKLLEAFKQTSDEKIGQRLLAALADSTGRQAVRAEALRPVLEKMPLSLREQGDQLLKQLDGERGNQQTRMEELLAACQDGDPQQGHSLFNSAKTACASCHAIGYLGGRVGPDLSRIGAVRSTRDLLESIAYPSATFVRSYEPMIISTRDGEQHSGILHHDTANRIRLVTGPSTEEYIQEADIIDIRPGALSLMPEGLDQQLSRSDLANLVAFLKSLK